MELIGLRPVNVFWGPCPLDPWIPLCTTESRTRNVVPSEETKRAGNELLRRASHGPGPGPGPAVTVYSLSSCQKKTLMFVTVPRHQPASSYSLGGSPQKADAPQVAHRSSFETPGQLSRPETGTLPWNAWDFVCVCGGGGAKWRFRHFVCSFRVCGQFSIPPLLKAVVIAGEPLSFLEGDEDDSVSLDELKALSRRVWVGSYFSWWFAVVLDRIERKPAVELQLLWI